MDNIKKLKVYGIDPKQDIKFYYRRMINGAVITACAIRLPWQTMGAQDAYARGLAVCTPQDQFNKKLGRTIAMGRAVAAIEKKRSFGDINTSFLIPEEFEKASLSTYGDVSVLTESERSLFKLDKSKEESTHGVPKG